MTCEHCAAEFRRSRGKRDAYRFCSKACAGASRTAAKRRRIDAERERKRQPCAICGGRCEGNIRRRFCSDACRDEQKRRAHVRRSALTCDACGVGLVFRLGHTRSTFCSATCRKRIARTRLRTSEWAKAKRRTDKALRRARSRGTACEPVDPIRVFNRDRWRCQLCRCVTPRKLRGSMEASAPELDHITPLACGGAHTYANTQCLCRRCNQMKGAKPLGQLRLAV